MGHTQCGQEKTGSSLIEGYSDNLGDGVEVDIAGQRGYRACS
jgi:hypothetical protein